MLTDEDKVTVGGHTLKILISREATLVRWTTEEEPQRCPVCRASLQAGDAVIRCGNCFAPHHAHCFEARTGRCGVFGCLAITRLAETTEERR